MLKVTKFQFPLPTRLGTVVKNILGAIMPPPPCEIGFNRYRACKWLRMFEVVASRLKIAAKVENCLRSLALLHMDCFKIVAKVAKLLKS